MKNVSTDTSYKFSLLDIPRRQTNIERFAAIHQTEMIKEGVFIWEYDAVKWSNAAKRALRSARNKSLTLFSFPVIAKYLGMTEGNVKGRLSKDNKHE